MQILKFLLFLSAVVFSNNIIAQEQSEAVQLGVDVSYWDKERSEVWGLSEDEYKRYRTLKELDETFADVKSSPYEVLGKHAETAEERNKYARRFAQMYAEAQVKALEWTIAVDRAVNEENISPLQIYDTSFALQSFLSTQGLSQNQARATFGGQPSSYDTKTTGHFNSTRSTLIVDMDCDGSCQKYVKEILTNKHQLGGIDMIFAGSKNNETDQKAISNLAYELGIKPDMVKSKSITLNYDTIKSIQARGGKTLPLLLDQNGDELR